MAEGRGVGGDLLDHPPLLNDREPVLPRELDSHLDPDLLAVLDQLHGRQTLLAPKNRSTLFFDGVFVVPLNLKFARLCGEVTLGVVAEPPVLSLHGILPFLAHLEGVGVELLVVTPPEPIVGHSGEQGVVLTPRIILLHDGQAQSQRHQQNRAKTKRSFPHLSSFMIPVVGS